jgi:hypothetical protein
MPVILATQKAEIRRTAVQSQPRQIFGKTLSWKRKKKKKKKEHKTRMEEWLKWQSAYLASMRP